MLKFKYKECPNAKAGICQLRNIVKTSVVRQALTLAKFSPICFVPSDSVTDFFLVLRRHDGRFINVEGRLQKYFNWNSGEPNNSGGNEACAVLYTNSAKWNDASCTSRHDFVCELKFC